MSQILAIGLIIGLFLFVRSTTRSKKWKTPKVKFPDKWRSILISNVAFYNSLNESEKQLFEFKVQEFLLNCDIVGVNTRVNILDKLLVASSAVIPILNFPDWKYPNIKEVIIYPDAFNFRFETKGPNRQIMGMVGYGHLEGKMVLSKTALRLGFENGSDKRNTAIHEFVHLIDKLDGAIDGIPEVLIEKQYVIPWIDLINEKIEKIYEKESDINPYGATNKAEFFSVISEYFFERPKLLAKKHPELYKHLELIFKQDMNERDMYIERKDISRNDPCPCNSGNKYKRCCGKAA